MSESSSAKYYQENKDRLQKKARERYENLSKEEKEKEQQYGCECYKLRKYFNLENFVSL